MRRPLSSVVLAAALCAAALTAAPAHAHEGDPNFLSTITAVTPAAKGVTLEILNRDDRLELVNRSGTDVVAYGYTKEPYVRILADGTVQVNRLSPATYLNEDRYGGASTPAFADPKAPPQWRTVDRSGRYEWHDHRIHYMAKGTPPQVRDTGTRTKVFDWRVPLAVGSTQGAVTGVLTWVPDADSGPPAAAIGGFAALLLAGGAAVVLSRRRRRAAGPAGDDDPRPPAPAAGEAW